MTPDPPRADRSPSRTEVRVRISVRGRVQGVWFRGSACEQAETLGIVGWAQNLGDGSVEIVAQGVPEAIEELVAWCRRGPPGARVASVDLAREATGDELHDFRIRR